MLFVLVVDVLNSIFQAAVQHGHLRCLTTRHAASSISLYADDIVLFCHPDEHDATTIRTLLDIFGEVSGMRMNYTKCSATPIQCSEAQAVSFSGMMASRTASFPIPYLGLPLSIRKPTHVEVLPLVDKLGNKLSTWRASMLSLGDGLALVRHVLCAMPTHFLVAININKPILSKVNRIIRGFLWAGRKAANGGQCRVNWAKVCRPTSLGGLGIQDLHQAGITLRTRWLWLQHTDPSRPWGQLHLPADAEATQIFRASTHWNLGDGNTCRFWTDSWLLGKSIADLAPLVLATVPKRRRRDRTVRQGLTDRAGVRDIHGGLGPAALVQYVELWRRVRYIELSDAPNTLTWRWTDSGCYTAKSCYLALFHGSIKDEHWCITWKTWAHLRIKIFTWLAF